MTNGNDILEFEENNCEWLEEEFCKTHATPITMDVWEVEGYPEFVEQEYAERI